MQKKSGSPHFISSLRKYGFYGLGILGGLALPVAATLADLSARGYPNDVRGFIQAQIQNPVLWIVDGATVILLVMCAAGILREIFHQQRIEELQDQLALRISELYNLKEISQNEMRVRQRAEAKITRAKREWESTFDAISDLIILIDSDGKIVRCNQATVQKLESTYKDVIGKPIEEVFPGVAEPIQKRVINKTQVIPMPSQFGWFEVTGFPFQLAPEQQGTIYIFHDINKRKRDEAEIQRQKQYFEAIFQHSPVAIVTLDLNGGIVTCNPAFVRLFGYSPVEVAGKKLDDLITPPELRDTAQEYTRRIRRREVLRMVTHRVTSSGASIEVELFNVPVIVNNEQLGTLVIFHDISDLVKAQRKAEEADLAKSEYLANISHEIRTPLNGLIGMLNLAMETDLSVMQSEYIKTASDQAESMLSLLNDVLDLSKIEARKMELENIHFDLRSIMENVALTMGQRASDKGLELVCIVPPAVPVLLRGDPNRLRQVLTNLVSNAVKFTEKGEVVLGVRQESQTGSQITLEFSVQDTGIGIPRERQSAVFDRFTQAADSTSRKYGGTGLGLSISAQLVDLMGGKISLKSEPDRGSTFVFTAVFQKVGDNPPIEANLKRRTRDLRVLIADANANSRSNLSLLLEGIGCKATGVANQETLLDRLEKAEASQKGVQLLILDNRLTGNHDLTIVEELRRNPHFQHLKIILLTRLGDTISEARFRQLDISAAILKPVRWQPLQAILLDLMLPPKKRTGQLPALPPDRRASQAMQTVDPQDVLLAEDNPVNRKVVVNLLEKFGHNVTAVENGKKVLEVLAVQGFNVILMDVQMPEMDGYSTTQCIRAMEGSEHHTPIIALTAHTFTSEIQRCFSSGMDAYLAKPLRPQELFDAIEQWSLPVPRVRPWMESTAQQTPAPPDKPAPPPSPSIAGEITDLDFADFSSGFDELVISTEIHGGEEAASPSAEPDSSLENSIEPAPVIAISDPDYLKNILPRFGNDLNFFLVTFEEFLHQSQAHTRDIANALRHGDARSVRLLAHNLKGIAANFSAGKIAHLAGEIEILAEKGSLSRAAELADNLQTEIPVLENEFRHLRI